MIWRCDLVPQYRAYESEIDAATKRVLHSGKYILGEEVKSFEQEFAAYNAARFAVGVANGTDALILSLKALGVGPGDEIITTPFTAIPTVSAIIATGAKPVFVDIDPETFLMDIRQVPGLVNANTKAVVPVHIFGNVVDVEKLDALIPSHTAIIEDAAQAHGSRMNGRLAGGMGDAGVFSFYPTKNLGGYGDGGMVVSNDSELADQVRLLRMYGMTDKDHIVVNGVNSRLDELQAAILRVKLKYLDKMNKTRNLIAEQYRMRLADVFRPQRIPPGVFSNYHVFAVRFKGDRDSLVEYLDQHGIQTNVYYPIPLHLQEANRFLGYQKGDLPKVEALCDEIMALPMYAELPAETLDLIIKTLNDYCLQKGPNK